MSGTFYQGIAERAAEIIGRECGITDEKGTVIASSKISSVGEKKAVIASESNISVYDGCTFVRSESDNGFIFYVNGVDGDAQRCCRLLAVLSGISDEHNSEDNVYGFIRRVISGEVSDEIIANDSLKFGLKNDVQRSCFVISCDGGDVYEIKELVGSLYPDENADFVVVSSSNQVTLVKEFDDHCDKLKIASAIADTVNAEALVHVRVGVGNPAEDFLHLSRSYREACVALEVGRIFSTESDVTCYDSLGLGRLIYQLPKPLCVSFLNEIFHGEMPDVLDSESLLTIQCFFENNLNISEASRKLFVHRNTLIYRLDKIKRYTGLDMRDFDDAVTLQVALMVNRYLSERPEQ